MIVTPSLFSPNVAPTRSTSEASEARRAFEAMLSANSARTRVLQSSLIGQDSAPDFENNRPIPTKANTTDASTGPLARPGRVLDIKV